MKRFFGIVSVVCISFGLISCRTTDMADKQDSKKVQYVIDVPTSVPLEKVKDALKEAISYRAGNYKANEDFLPDELPDTPGTMTMSNQQFGGMMGNVMNGNPQFELMKTDTTGAYFTVSGNMDIHSWSKMGGVSNQATFIAAIYPSKKVTRVYLRGYYQGTTQGLSGLLAQKAVEAVDIKTKDPALFYVGQVEYKLQQELPELKVVSTTPSELKDLKINTAAGGLIEY